MKSKGLSDNQVRELKAIENGFRYWSQNALVSLIRRDLLKVVLTDAGRAELARHYAERKAREEGQ